MNNRLELIIVWVAVALSPLLSMALAYAGEPQSVWLWRDVLGLL